MTQGKVNLKIVGDRLQLMEDCLVSLRALPVSSLKEFTSDVRNPAAAESLLRRAIQAIFDTLKHLLSKIHGRGLLEYKQQALLAAEQGIIRDPTLAEVLLKLGGFRNRLTHFYDEVTAEELYDILKNKLGDLEAISEELRQAAARAADV